MRFHLKLYITVIVRKYGITTFVVESKSLSLLKSATGTVTLFNSYSGGS